MSKERLVPISFLPGRIKQELPSMPTESLSGQPVESGTIPLFNSNSGIKHFYEMPYGNPRFREDQRRVLDSLTVGRTHEVLPSDLFSLYQTHKDKIGNHTVKLPNSTLVKLSLLPNGIATIRRMRRITPWWAPLPCFRITDYYDVDGQNNTAWDVFQLLCPPPKHSEEKKPTKPVEVISVPPILNAFFAPTRYLNLLMLNRLSSDSFLGRLVSKLLARSKILEITDALIPAHESGHKWQFREYFPLESFPRPPTHIRLKTFFLPLISKIFPRKAAQIRTELETYKTQRCDQERNAHAFALSAGRRLRDLGLDTLRGYSISEIEGAVDFALSSYDKAFKKLPGMPFSQKERIIYKRKKKEEEEMANQKEVE